jgi:hypothetical protein
MIEFAIKVSKDKELKAVLREPLFNEYRFATIELMKVPGHIDKLACGSSLIQHCWQDGDESLKNGDESKNPEIATAYASLCIDVYQELYIAFDIEVKKK